MFIYFIFFISDIFNFNEMQLPLPSGFEGSLFHHLNTYFHISTLWYYNIFLFEHTSIISQQEITYKRLCIQKWIINDVSFLYHSSSKRHLSFYVLYLFLQLVVIIITSRLLFYPSNNNYYVLGIFKENRLLMLCRIGRKQNAKLKKKMVFISFWRFGSLFLNNKNCLIL